MMVGPFSRPSGSITSGLDRNGSIIDGGMLGISWRDSDSARIRGPTLVVPLGAVAVVLGVVGVVGVAGAVVGEVGEVGEVGAAPPSLGVVGVGPRSVPG